MSLKVKLWGIRGSLPTPYAPEQVEQKVAHLLEEFALLRDQEPSVSVEDFLEQRRPVEVGGYGGHTACVEVMTDQSNVIIDGGSGIRRLGEKLACGACGLGRGEVHILMTHFHWDHLIGLPFFVPIFIPGNKIHFYAVQDDLEAQIRNMFRKPNFPVPYEALGSEIQFHQLEPRKAVQFGDMNVTPYQLDHPDPCWGYRVEHKGKVFSYCVDTECRRVSQKDLGADLPLYQGVDLMVLDAQYTFSEAADKIDWGHASAPVGLDIAMREGVKKLLFVHHDPAASDIKIMAAEEQTRSYYESCLASMRRQNDGINEVDWEFAREGMLIEV